MSPHDFDKRRRDFLKNLTIAGAAVVAGCAAGPATAVLEPEETPNLDDAELLEQPIVLGRGETLEDRSFVLSRGFRGSSANAIILVNGDGVRIRDVRIFGPAQWSRRWNDTRPNRLNRPGYFGQSIGIRAQNVSDLQIQRVSIEGLPRAAIAGYGLESALFSDIRIRHCYHGINLVHNAPSRLVTVERVHVSDLWGPPPEFATPDGKANSPSRGRPSGWIGGDGLALNSLRDSSLIECVAVGEMFASFKITNPRRVTVRGLRGAGFQLQGVAAGVVGEAMEPARDVLIEDCLFDKALGYGRDLYDANCVQFTYHIESARMRRCVLNAAGKNGHGIQVTTDAHVSIQNCTIRGFNGVRGENPAHALAVAKGSTVNSNFARVNQFVDQQRIRLDRR